MLPHANIPDTEVCMCSFTIGPDVEESIETPHPVEISFSGINPTDKSSVSHSIYSSVSMIAFRSASTAATETPSRRSFP